MNNIKLFVTVTTSTVVVAVAVKSAINVHRTEQLKRLEIERNLQLDLKAIKKAGLVQKEWMDNASFADLISLNYVMNRLDNEIKFQKIAIREEES